MCTFSVLCILSVHAVIAVASRSRKKRAQEYKAKENILGNACSDLACEKMFQTPYNAQTARCDGPHVSFFQVGCRSSVPAKLLAASPNRSGFSPFSGLASSRSLPLSLWQPNAPFSLLVFWSEEGADMGEERCRTSGGGGDGETGNVNTGGFRESLLAISLSSMSPSVHPSQCFVAGTTTVPVGAFVCNCEGPSDVPDISSPRLSSGQACCVRRYAGLLAGITLTQDGRFRNDVGWRPVLDASCHIQSFFEQTFGPQIDLSIFLHSEP